MKKAFALPESLVIERQPEIFRGAPRAAGNLGTMYRVDRGTSAIAWKMKVPWPQEQRMSDEGGRFLLMVIPKVFSTRAWLVRSCATEESLWRKWIFSARSIFAIP
jgi:hypothetical protein